MFWYPVILVSLFVQYLSKYIVFDNIYVKYVKKLKANLFIKILKGTMFLGKKFETKM